MTLPANLSRADIAAATTAVTPPPQRAMMTLKPTTVLDHSQRRAERMAFRVAERSVSPIHVRRRIAQGARRQWWRENLAVAYAQGRARCWTARCPESSCMHGARPNTCDALDTVTWELCRELPPLP